MTPSSGHSHPAAKRRTAGRARRPAGWRTRRAEHGGRRARHARAPAGPGAQRRLFERQRRRAGQLVAVGHPAAAGAAADAAAARAAARRRRYCHRGRARMACVARAAGAGEGGAAATVLRSRSSARVGRRASAPPAPARCAKRPRSARRWLHRGPRSISSATHGCTVPHTASAGSASPRSPTEKRVRPRHGRAEHDHRAGGLVQARRTSPSSVCA
jgi:hypothetical protein